MTAADQDKFAKLYARIEDLEAEVRWLKGDGEDDVSRVKAVLGLSAFEARFLLALSRREQLTKQQLWTALYGDRHGEKQPELKTLDVVLAHLRAKLPGDITIETVWGVGLRMDAASRGAVAAIATGMAASDRAGAGPRDTQTSLHGGKGR